LDNLARYGAFYCNGQMLPRAVPARICGRHGFETIVPLCVARVDDFWLERFAVEWRLRYYDYIGVPCLYPPETSPRVRPLHFDWPENPAERDGEENAPSMSDRATPVRP
jgi:hypothetical protein